MIAVIFEAEPATGQQSRYFDIAAELRANLDRIDGFISVERFQSLSNEGRILSLSFWRDEAAIAEWRKLEQHRLAQSEGRSGVFRDYRLLVAEIIRAYGLSDRDQAPADSTRHHSTGSRQNE